MVELVHNSFQVLCIEMLFSFLCLLERLAQTSENGRKLTLFLPKPGQYVNNEGSYEESVTKTQKKKLREKFKSD